MRSFLAALLLLPAASSVAGRVLQEDEVCSNGMPGFESDVSFGDFSVCCPTGCGFCGGAGCSANAPEGYSADECCAGAVLSAGISCEDAYSPPCILTDSFTTDDGETEETDDGETEETDDDDEPEERNDYLDRDPFPTTDEILEGIDADSVFAEMVELHNQIRCIHGTPPLVLVDDPILANARFGVRCLAAQTMFDGTDINVSANGCNEDGCDTAEILEFWYDDQTRVGGPTTYGVDARQLLWSEATEVGCILDTCRALGAPFDTVFIACRYNAGVRPEELSEFINVPVETAEFCGYDGLAAVSV